MHDDEDISDLESYVREWESVRVEFLTWWKQNQGERMAKSKYLAWKAWLCAYNHYKGKKLCGKPRK